MSCLDSLTNITLGNIASDFSLHLMPPKLLFQILIHLSSSGMDRIKSIMSLLQDNFFQLRICWYTKASFVPQNSFFVLGESGYFACTDTTLDFVDTSISFLCLFDLTDQSGMKFYASQKILHSLIPFENLPFLCASLVSPSKSWSSSGTAIC